MIYTIIAFILGLLIGAFICTKIINFSEKFKKNQYLIEINSHFKQLLESIKSNKSKFKSRCGATVYIESVLDKWGTVDIVYLLDKKDIAVFKDNKCVLTTESIEVKTIEEITTLIDNKFSDSINDVVEIMGIVFSRQDFEKTFNIQFEEIMKNMPTRNEVKNLSDVEEILQKNESKFDIDEILDKISNSGVESLTQLERQFLDKYSNDKRN